jgi:pyruvate kinase
MTRRTKIVCTIGPASDSPDVLDALVEAGMDVARLNASHAGPAELAARLEAVRAAAQRAGRHVAAMLDLAGPKLRIGEVAEGTVLRDEAPFELVAEECAGDATRACINHQGLADDVSSETRIFIDDGRIELEVTGTDAGVVTTRVVTGGPLSSRKGVNVPGVRLSIEPVTRFDRAMVQWAIAKDVEYVAQSFVRESADLLKLRELMGEVRIPVVAKIERYEAVQAIDSIVAGADAVMVARGDLGIEASPETVPVMQREIVSACRSAGKPVIVATEMLESMVAARRPTRAEASDVANAIFDEVDAILLSAETAVGAHPALVTQTAARIVAKTEESMVSKGRQHRSTGGPNDIAAAVSAAACDLASDLRAEAIITPTESGATARVVSAHRPDSFIIAPTPYEDVARQLALAWGVRPLVIELPSDVRGMLDAVANAAHEAELVQTGDKVVVTAGIATRKPGATDLVVARHV